MQYLASLYATASKAPNTLGSDTLEALQQLRPEQRDKQRLKTDKVKKKAKEYQLSQMSALQKAKAAVMKRQAAEAANKPLPG